MLLAYSSVHLSVQIRGRTLVGLAVRTSCLYFAKLHLKKKKHGTFGNMY